MKVFLTLLIYFVGQLLIVAHAKDIVLSGTVYSESKLTLSAEQSGQLIFVADVGSEFKKGDAIARIDNQYEQQQLSQLKLEQQNLKEKIVENKRIIDSYASLTLENFVSKEQQIQKKVELLNSQYELNRTEQNLLKLRYVLNKKNVVAPYDGVILTRLVRPHEVVQAGEPLVTILNPKALSLEVRVPLNSYESLNLKQVDLLEAAPGISVTLDSVIPEVDMRSSTIKVLYTLKGGGVLIGQSLKVKIQEKVK